MAEISEERLKLLEAVEWCIDNEVGFERPVIPMAYNQWCLTHYGPSDTEVYGPTAHEAVATLKKELGK